MDPLFLEILKVRLDRALSSLIQLKMSLSLAGGELHDFLRFFSTQTILLFYDLES